MTHDAAGRPLIQLFHVHRRYGHQHALVDISLDISAGELVFITGPSGAGKSTLMKLLYLGEVASAGQILVDGQNLECITPREIPRLRRKFGIVFQDYKLIATRNVYDNVALVLEAANEPAREISRKVMEVLRMVGMEGRATAMPPSLSGGEQQRVAVARAVVGRPTIICADEPTGSLDPDTAHTILRLLLGLHRYGTTLIIATHDQELMRLAGGRVIRLDRGHLRQSDEHGDNATHAGLSETCCA
jgi:cell division transport system ATP-binding protein